MLFYVYCKGPGQSVDAVGLCCSYSATLPRLLVSVYDELMQPLPDSLAMFASPNKSADSSVLNDSLQSHDSIADPGSQSDVLQTQSSRNLRWVSGV